MNMLTGLNAGDINENAAVVWFTGKLLRASNETNTYPRYSFC